MNDSEQIKKTEKAYDQTVDDFVAGVDPLDNLAVK